MRQSVVLADDVSNVVLNSWPAGCLFSELAGIGFGTSVHLSSREEQPSLWSIIATPILNGESLCHQTNLHLTDQIPRI